MQRGGSVDSWRKRLHEGLPLYGFIVRLAITLFVAIAVVGPVKALVYLISGENVDFARSVLNSLMLAALIGVGCLGAAALAAIAGHFFWRHQRVGPWVLGLAASAGLWGTFALVPPKPTESDVLPLLGAVVVFGILFGYGISRLQKGIRENAP